jgi:molecular chaperone DnaK (HSP70)
MAAEQQNHRKMDDKLLFSLFKLLLDKDSNVDNKYRGQFPTRRLIADYLRHVDLYVKKIIEKQNPNAVQEHCYCITVPAMWDDKAKSIMREAAIEAGMIKATDEPERLILTSEPEAAALECERAHVKGAGIQDHETIIICDAGGGTIDLTVYQVSIEGEKKYFEELTRGHGKSCGSSYIDDLAKLWIRGHLDQCTQRFSENALDTMVKNFRDEHKVRFMYKMAFYIWLFY